MRTRTRARSRTRRGLAIGAAAAIALLVPSAAVAQETHGVEVVDNEFQPDQIEIATGDTVEWTQTGNNPHTITDEGGRFDESTSNGDTFSYTYDEPGEYPYYCRIHGAEGGVGMSGVVVVQAAQQPPAETEEPPADEPAPEETTAEEPPEEEAEDGDEGAAAVTGSIAASDQQSDGTTVLVDEVEISGSAGFVVVHLDEDGGPGPVLGHEPIPEGRSTAVHVTLDEPLDESATLWPMLHTDQGAAGTYEFPGADGPVMSGGEVVMVPIEYTVGLAFTGPPAGRDLALLGAFGVAVLAAGTALVRRRPARR